MMKVPAGNLYSPISASSATLRTVLHIDGEWRMVSSTARIARSGCSRSRAHWSGWSQSTCIEAASRLRGVSVPATRMENASIRSSAASSRSPPSSIRIRSDNRSSVRCLAPAGDHVIDVVVELAPRLQYDRLLLGEVAVEADDFEDVLGPAGELLPVLARRAEKGADDRNWIRPRDVAIRN